MFLGGDAVAPLKLQRDVRENGENPLLPRNCKRRLCTRRKPLPKVGRPVVLESSSQETGRAAVVHVPLPRGRRSL